MAATRRATTRRATARRAIARWLPSRLLVASAASHLVALGLLVLSPARWRWAAGIVVVDHLLLVAASVSPRSSLLGPNLTRLPASAADRGEVALTFDDGPDPRVTPLVLDQLEAAGARASFFLVGRRAAAHPDLVAEIVRRGHRVENHTWSHHHGFAFLGARGLGREISRAQGLLTDLTGRAPNWFRAPAGMRNPLLSGVLAAHGLALVSWTRRGFDAVSRHPATVADRLTRGLAGGDVLLLHDGGLAVTGGQPAVLEALPRVLEALRRQGLSGVCLPDRATRAGSSPVAGSAGREGAA